MLNTSGKTHTHTHMQLHAYTQQYATKAPIISSIYCRPPSFSQHTGQVLGTVRVSTARIRSVHWTQTKEQQPVRNTRQLPVNNLSLVYSSAVCSCSPLYTIVSGSCLMPIPGCCIIMGERLLPGKSGARDEGA
jgi:hypothetical protein